LTAGLAQEPAFTVVDRPAAFAATLDYILFSPPAPARPGRRAAAVLAPPGPAAAAAAVRGGLPRGPYPSDHLLLAADLRFAPPLSPSLAPTLAPQLAPPALT
jgi:hypothetical protein